MSHYSYLIHVVAIIKSLLADYHEQYKPQITHIKVKVFGDGLCKPNIEQHGVLFSIEDAVQVPGTLILTNDSSLSIVCKVDSL